MFRYYITCLMVGALLFGSALGIENIKENSDKQEVGVFTILGEKIDKNQVVTDSNGKVLTIEELLNKEIPTIVIPVYYACPRLCGLTIKGTLKLVNELELKLGTDYQILTYSISPEENFELAAGKKESVGKELTESPKAGFSGWHFAVTSPENIKKISDKLGYKFVKDGDVDYAHSSAIFIVTPSGEISQYFTGIEFPAWDVKLALVEASKNKIGDIIDHALLFCYRFDPTKGRYTMVAFNTLRFGVFISLALIGIMAYWFSKKVR